MKKIMVILMAIGVMLGTIALITPVQTAEAKSKVCAPGEIAVRTECISPLGGGISVTLDVGSVEVTKSKVCAPGEIAVRTECISPL